MMAGRARLSADRHAHHVTSVKLFMFKTLNTVFVRALHLAGLAACLAAPSSLSAQSYHNMAASNFTENFADIADTTTWASPTKTGGSWSGFVATSTVPATGLPDPTKTTTNSTAFSSGFTGGVQRGSTQIIPTESLIFLSTGGDNTTATGLDLLLDFTSRLAGTLTFDVATVANSTGNRQGTLSIHASLDGEIWTPVAGTNLPYVATNNVAGSASVSASLPSSLNGQGTVRLRFYYHNNASDGSPSGSRPKISVDNVLVTSSPTVAGLPEITSASTASVTALESFSHTITATEAPTSFSTSTLPTGLSLDSATGVISGAPTTPGTYNITVSAINGVGTGSAILTLTVGVNPNAPVVTDGDVTAELNVPFTHQIVATNSPSSYATGTLPAGLVLDAETGVISGTPTAGGTFDNILISATNAFGTDEGSLRIVVASPPVLTGSFSASIYLGQAFAHTITATQSPTYYEVTGLPEGLTWDFAANISGTPTTAGTHEISISAFNTLGSDTRTLVLTVLDQAAQDAIPLTVAINKYANGQTGQPDKVELLVIGNGAPGSTADLRGMILKDFSSGMANDGGGKFEFANDALWSAVPAGTLVVMSSGNTETEDLEASDFVLRVNLGNAACFTSLGGTFDVATTDFLLIKQAGTGALGVAGGIHALAGGTAGAQFTAFTGLKAIATGTTGAGNGVYVTTPNSTLADFDGTDAVGGVAALPFGLPNNSTNEALINALRGATATTPLEDWRLANFGTAENSGAAADGADFDGDGIANLIEYATGADPTTANASPITLATTASGEFLTLSFTRIDDPALSYVIEASDDLAAGFAPTGTSYTGGPAGTITHTDTVSLTTPGVRRFLRLVVGHGTAE